MLFVNTRPVERAAALTAAVRASGVKVLELPLLALEARPLTAQLKQQFKDMPEAKVIVVVSPIAVEIGMRYLKQLNISLDALAHIQWVAVGKTTADCLATYGFVSHVPKVETSEGMLTLPVLQTLEQGAKIAFWRGEGGRQFMMQHLTDLGYSIENTLLYERKCPESARIQLQNHLNLFALHPLRIVLISSEASWLNWLSLAEPYPDLILNADYWVLGQRLADVVVQYQQQHEMPPRVHILDALKTDLLVEQLQARQGKL